MILRDFVFPKDVEGNSLFNRLLLVLQDILKSLQFILNGGLNFADNFDGTIIEADILAGSNTAISNPLKNTTMKGFIVVWANVGGTVFVPTASTVETIYFRASISGRYKVLVF
jgi:hypothetical protein